jgi:hypothetical protein
LAGTVAFLAAGFACIFHRIKTGHCARVACLTPAPPILHASRLFGRLRGGRCRWCPCLQSRRCGCANFGGSLGGCWGRCGLRWRNCGWSGWRGPNHPPRGGRAARRRRPQSLGLNGGDIQRLGCAIHTRRLARACIERPRPARPAAAKRNCKWKCP